MSSSEYLAELHSYLETLSPIECEAALHYYENEFEKGDSETSVMLRLGNPYSLAKRIIAENSDFNESTVYKNLKKDGVTSTVPDKLQSKENYPNIDYKEPEKYVLPKVKTAYDKPSAAYVSPPVKKSNRSGKGRLFAVGAVAICFFLACVFFTGIAFIVGSRNRANISYTYPESTAVAIAEDIYAPDYVEPVEMVDDKLYIQEPVGNFYYLNINVTGSEVKILKSDTIRIEHTSNINVSDYSSDNITIDGFDGKVIIYLDDNIENIQINIVDGTLILESSEIFDADYLGLNATESVIKFIPPESGENESLDDTGINAIPEENETPVVSDVAMNPTIPEELESPPIPEEIIDQGAPKEEISE
jgi:hypothetical protein